MANFKLDPAQTNLLNFIQQHQQAIFSGILSTIAIKDFKYNVDEKTQFRLNSDLTEIEITQLGDNTKDQDKENAKDAIKSAK